MSLRVPDSLLKQAEQGNVSGDDFVACVKASLPYAWQVISNLVERTKGEGTPFADDGTPPPSDQAHGELLRAMSSDAIRAALQQHFGVRIAFQNCCRVGVFTPAASNDVYDDFVSPRAQLTNQAPELINC